MSPDGTEAVIFLSDNQYDFNRQLTVEVVKQESIGPNHTKVDLRIANAGYLGTYGLQSAKKW